MPAERPAHGRWGRHVPGWPAGHGRGWPGRPDVGWRWVVVAAGVAVLVALPAVVAAVPVRDDPTVPAAALLDRIRASAGVPFEGYAESRGTVGLPDIPELGDVPALLGSTTRLRA